MHHVSDALACGLKLNPWSLDIVSNWLTALPASHLDKMVRVKKKTIYRVPGVIANLESDVLFSYLTFYKDKCQRSDCQSEYDILCICLTFYKDKCQRSDCQSEYDILCICLTFYKDKYQRLRNSNLPQLVH